MARLAAPTTPALLPRRPRTTSRPGCCRREGKSLDPDPDFVDQLGHSVDDASAQNQPAWVERVHKAYAACCQRAANLPQKREGGLVTGGG